MDIDNEFYNHRVEEEKRLTEIESDLKAVKKQLEELQESVSQLVAAWRAASWLVAAVKWIGGLAMAAGAILHFKGLR